MNPGSKKTLIALVGPTAIGKTAKAIRLAELLGCEILSADSRQFYREISIGTAKPSPEELSRVPHHFINSHNISEDFTAGDYEIAALAVLEKVFARQDYAILTGGSGLFINAVLYGLDILPKPALGVRDRLNQAYKQTGIIPLQQRLKSIDPAYYAEVDIANPQRIIRAIEVFESTGIPFSEWRKNQKQARKFESIIIGLEMDRRILYDRINKRVDQMIEDGLLREARMLFSQRDRPPLRTVGYTELFDYFDGKHTLTTAIEKIKQNSRRYAKRQMTWFKRDPAIHWFKATTEPEVLTDFVRTESGSDQASGIGPPKFNGNGGSS